MNGEKLARLQHLIEGAQMRVLNVLVDKITDGKEDEETAHLLIAKNYLNCGIDLLENDSWLCDHCDKGAVKIELKEDSS